jgi:predicted dehydrogenase
VGKLRLGVIGAGSWAVASHLPNFAERRDDVEFVAVARKGREALERIKDRFGFAVASEDYRDVLDAGADICLVSSPTSLHYEHAKAAMEAGAHVLVEKPFTLTSAQAWDLVATGERLGRHIVQAFGWNYGTMMIQMKQLMDEHGVGDIEHLTIQMSSTTRELLSNTGAYPQAAPDTVPEQATWTDPAISGGGYAQAQLCHALGAALWLTGQRATEVFALMSATMGAPVEMHDAISVRYDDGAIGTLSGGSSHVGIDDNKHQLEIRAIGSAGQMLLDLGREAATLWRDEGKIDVRLDLAPDAGVYDCIGPPNTLVDLALGRDVVNRSPGELGARTVELLETAYRSAASGQIERVARG